MTAYYHGGFGGLRVGDRVLPPAVTGASSTADHGAEGVCRRDRVYLATEETAAALFAALHPSGRGKIYQVEPVGELEPDPDCNEPGMSWAAPEARVLRVIQLSRARRAEIQIAILGAPIQP